MDINDRPRKLTCAHLRQLKVSGGDLRTLGDQVLLGKIVRDATTGKRKKANVLW